VVRRYGPASRPQPIDLRDTQASQRHYQELSRQRIATCGRLFREVLSRREHDLYVFGCADLHSATHLCWTHGDEGERRLLQLHQDLDREMEQVCNLAPAGSRILAASTYGVASIYPVADIAEIVLRGLGYQQAPRGQGKFSVPDLVPEALRRKLSEHLPQDIQEDLLNRNLRDNTDWSRSVAFGLPTLYTGHIRVNLRGREPQGIVEPGHEYRQVVRQIMDDFAKLESPVAAKIRSIEELTGEIPTHLPDIMISWQERDLPWDAVAHPRFRAPIQRHRFHRSTYHRYRGFVGALDSSDLDGMPATLDIPDVAAHLRAISARPISSAL